MPRLTTLLLLSAAFSCALAKISCGGGEYCGDDTTCCKLDSGLFACCPGIKAVCCNDQKHCCPSGFKCEAAHCAIGQPNGRLLRVPFLTKVPSIKLPKE